MVAEINSLVDRYTKWLRDKTVVRQASAEWVEITTPYLDRHNDYIQIYARKQGSRFVLSDDGYTLADLAQSGCKLDSPKRQQILEMTLNGLGVQNNAGRLEVITGGETFAVKKNDLVQAVLAVNDLFYLSSPTVLSLFKEDVTAWLDENDIRYAPSVKLSGRSGFDHLFDFVIPKSRKSPERLVQAINRPSRDAAEQIAFRWFDTREARPADAVAFAMINDRDERVGDAVLEALRNYEITPVLWSKRSAELDRLAA